MGLDQRGDKGVRLEDFLAGNCEATKAKYAAELDNAGGEWGKALDFRYAESLVYFGMLERHTETLYTESGRVLGSKVTFRKSPKDSPKDSMELSIPERNQTDLFAERFA
jgi:hypothetical protein